MLAMAKTRRKSTKKQKKQEPSFPPELAGTVLLLLAGLTLVSLFTPNQGSVTSAWFDFLRLLIGWGRYVVWIVLGMLALWFFQRYEQENQDEKWEKPVGTLLVLMMLLTTFYLIDPGIDVVEPGGGGLIGWVLGQLLESALGRLGTIVSLIALIPLVVIMISGLSLRQIYTMGWDLWYRYQDWRHFRQLRINQPSRPHIVEPKARFIDRVLPAGASRGQIGPPAGKDEPPIVVVQRDDPPPPATPTDPEDMRVGPATNGHHWQLPMLDQIFDAGVEQEISQTEMRQRARLIEETLLSFGVEVKVLEINPGPAVTQFSIQPGESKDKKGNSRKVRVSRIVNLSNDLALALAASPIRIEAPIPGRPYVGIEVPNSTKNMVLLRSLMESERFVNGKGALRLALGQDVSGRAVVADLATMPHLLIAGATGSGKSVCINTIVSCLIGTHTPTTLRMLMVDPKRVELINYNGIPHLLAPVVTELDRVVGVLGWATREMDRRYKLFAKESSRHIVSYNEKMHQKGQETLPYIVIIIDELADLMMMAPDEVERTITRIAQMARATGMHLIIATQRPSVNVVTGLIKANFPARIAFAVSSLVDSRVILDAPGAENLLGKGDMLYMAADASKLQRIQGAFVSDKELNRLVRFWKGTVHENGDRGEKRPPVDMPTDLVQQELWDDLKADDNNSKEDKLLERAIEVVRDQGKASISLLQRRLRIGYARAARLIDEMEEQGIIGSDEGSGRARPVLITKADDAANPLAEDE